ncbi:MAG: UTP--glucose-1-phosphate uridylyltransferase [Dehalococcoidia bacterium]|nr:UTP--glucose-1-phosphate uridylyltransferase [Dehalococcoidia bacterium]
MASVRRAVILAAGLGTRMLPATKSVAKEMLPIVDRPIIQYAVEEAAAAGIEEIVMVLAPDRGAIREHFGGGSRTEAIARARGNAALIERVVAPERLARFTFVEQREPLGTGHAVQQARPYLEGEPFALLFPDDIILGAPPCTAQLIAPYEGCGAAAVVAVQQVAAEQIPQYGIVDPEGPGNPARLRGIVEKPAADEAPSDLGVVGRYVLGPSIFDQLEKLEPGAGGELQLTDAIAGQIASGEAVYACRFEGRRYDAGRPAGAIAAAVAAAFDREEIRTDLLAHLTTLMPREQ